MLKVSIGVRSGAARFNVAVQAESIQGAVSLAEGLYPASDIRVTFPIAPETYFVRDFGAQAGQIESEEPENTAA